MPTIIRPSVSTVSGGRYTPWDRSTRCPSGTATAVPASATANATSPVTRALAASTRPRRGHAASVTLISPLRYSAVMTMAPTTARMIRAMNAPARVCAGVVPIPDGP